MSEAHGHHEDHTQSYLKTYYTLLALFAVSVAGPMLEIQWLTLVTAFGIAVVKAYLVASKFMHLNVEKRYIVYLFLTALAFMALFFFGVAPDVMKGSGTNWEKPGWDDPAPVVEPSHGEHGAAESGH